MANHIPYRSHFFDVDSARWYQRNQHRESQTQFIVTFDEGTGRTPDLVLAAARDGPYPFTPK